MEASIDAVQPEASTTLEQAESHAHICAKLAEEHKDDVLVCVALTDAAAIIRDLMRERLADIHHIADNAVITPDLDANPPASGWCSA